MVFLTQDGPEICELLLVHAQNFKAATSVLPATQRDGLQLVPTTMRPLTMESLADDIALLEMEMDDRDSSRLDAVQAAAQAEMAEQRVQLQAQVGMMEFSIKAALAEASAAEESLLWEVDALEDESWGLDRRLAGHRSRLVMVCLKGSSHQPAATTRNP